jgi:hypothetical protein
LDDTGHFAKEQCGPSRETNEPSGHSLASAAHVGASDVGGFAGLAGVSGAWAQPKKIKAPTTARDFEENKAERMGSISLMSAPTRTPSNRSAPHLETICRTAW